jgi:hypothetical protein
MEMKRFGLLLLVLAAAAGFATPSQGDTIVELNDGAVLGDQIWDLTINTTVGSNDLGGQLSIDNAVSFTPNPAICDPLNNIVICAPLTGPDLDPSPSLADNLFLIIAVVQAGALDGGVPRLLGQITSSGLPALTLAGLDILDPVNQNTALNAPVTFINPVPEPAAMAFVAMALGSLALLRRRAA